VAQPNGATDKETVVSFEPVTPYKRKGKVIKGCWQLNFYFELPDGTMFRKREKCRLSSKSAANDQWKKREVELWKELTKPKEEQKLIGPKLGVIWPDYITHCEGEKQKDATVENKEYYWNAWLSVYAGKHLSEIDNSVVSKLRSAMKGLAASTVNNVGYALTGCLKYALDLKLISEMPCKIKRLKRKKTSRGFWEPVQLDVMLAHALPDERVFLLLGSHAGLRAGEICGLDKVDVNVKERHLTVKRTVRRKKEGTPKNGNEREVALSKTLASELERYMQMTDHARVLMQKSGRVMTVAVLGRMLKRICKRAGLPPTTHTHLLRHSFITNLGSTHEAAPRVIMDLAGHERLDTTLGYMHLHRNAARAAVSLLDGLGSRLAAEEGTLLN
jgi:integrase